MKQTNYLDLTPLLLGAVIILFAILLHSCSPDISVQRAADRGARCGQHLR